jgi:hypothetical protein
MDELALCVLVARAQEGSSVDFTKSGLVHKCFTQWVMTSDQIFIACMQSCQEPLTGNASGLSSRSTITTLARQYQIPYFIDAVVPAQALQQVWKKMIHIGEVDALRTQRNVAVETSSLLVT